MTDAGRSPTIKEFEKYYYRVMNHHEFHRWSFLRSMLIMSNGTVPYSAIHKATGLAKSTVSQTLKGDFEPSPDTVRKLASYLNTVASKLVKMSEDHIAGI